ncbi:MAG: 3'-5' exonuclease [Gammaproteobacteria bacterium]
MTELTLTEILSDPNYKILRRLPESLERQASIQPIGRVFSAVIVDLETIGLNPKLDPIIEIGLLKFSFTNEEGIIEITDSYNELNDPDRSIPEEITEITGITNEDVEGKAIDWNRVTDLLKNCHLVICHNAEFDRNFLELQTPENIKSIFKKLPFACTINDVNWKSRGFESQRLDYLNWKLGYFYDAHRALTDCWATLNLLLKEEGAFDELKSNVKKKRIIIQAIDAPFDNKDLLKARAYKWNDGVERSPKCWWTIIFEAYLESEIEFLENEIYQSIHAAQRVRYLEVTASTRYSFREWDTNVSSTSI